MAKKKQILVPAPPPAPRNRWHVVGDSPLGHRHVLASCKTEEQARAQALALLRAIYEPNWSMYVRDGEEGKLLDL